LLVILLRTGDVDDLAGPESVGQPTAMVSFDGIQIVER
jgi:hypothetical protein